MTSDPDVILLRWAFWVQGDLILFITGAGSTRQCLQAFKSRQVPKSVPIQGCQLCHGLSLLEMHSGRNDQ